MSVLHPAALGAVESRPRCVLEFFLNGERIVVADAQPDVSLLEFIRARGCTGTKLGCGEVGLVLYTMCGFSVVLGRLSVHTPCISHRCINALMLRDRLHA